VTLSCSNTAEKILKIVPTKKAFAGCFYTNWFFAPLNVVKTLKTFVCYSRYNVFLKGTQLPERFNRTD
jgi:hypothetical protein